MCAARCSHCVPVYNYAVPAHDDAAAARCVRDARASIHRDIHVGAHRDRRPPHGDA